MHIDSMVKTCFFPQTCIFSHHCLCQDDVLQPCWPHGCAVLPVSRTWSAHVPNSDCFAWHYLSDDLLLSEGDLVSWFLWLTSFALLVFAAGPVVMLV